MADWVGILQALVALVVGGGQCLLIYYGLRRMEKTGARRDKQVEDQGKVLEEIGAGIQEQISLSREAREQQGKALEKMGAGIEALLERTPRAA